MRQLSDLSVIFLRSPSRSIAQQRVTKHGLAQATLVNIRNFSRYLALFYNVQNTLTRVPFLSRSLCSRRIKYSLLVFCCSGVIMSAAIMREAPFSDFDPTGMEAGLTSVGSAAGGAAGGDLDGGNEKRGGDDKIGGIEEKDEED